MRALFSMVQVTQNPLEVHSKIVERFDAVWEQQT
jgi:hypothetical protein